MPLTDDPQTLETATKLVNALRGAFNTPNAYRPAHAKGHIIKGTFKPTSQASFLSKAPHFNNSTTPILLRFSNSTGLPNIPDNSPNASPRGLALRCLLSEDGHQHTDIITHSTPYFPSRTGEDFLDLLEALGDGSIAEYLEGNAAAKAFVEAPKPHPKSFANERFYGVNAFKFVNGEGREWFGRYRILPEAGYEILDGDEVKAKSEGYLFEELQARLTEEEVKFRLEVQIAEEGDVVDDATVRWPEEREIVELGTLTAEEYVEENESRKEQQKLIFDPIPRIEGIEASDDPILDMRAALYLISGRIRRQADDGVVA